MNFLDTIILGIVEGITEFLPISSTAHLEITEQLLRIPITDFVKSFTIIIQLGAILAVLFLYREKFFNSYKYSQNDILVLTQSMIDAIPLNNLVRLQGTEKMGLLCQDRESGP